MSQSNINNNNKKEPNINVKKNKASSNSNRSIKKNTNSNETSNEKNKPSNLKKKEIKKPKINSLEYLSKMITSEKKPKSQKNLKNKKSRELLLSEKHKPITYYEKEYEKLNNLCNNKKNNRSKDEIKKFMKKQRSELIKQKNEQKKQRTNKNLKIFIGFEILQREIQNQKTQINPKTPPINKFLKKTITKKEEDDSKGSILTANDMRKDFYIKCMDTMRIYTPHYGMLRKKLI